MRVSYLSMRVELLCTLTKVKPIKTSRQSLTHVWRRVIERVAHFSYYGGPELILLIPLLPLFWVGGALSKIPEEAKKKYDSLKKDIDLKLKAAELALDDQKTNINKESKFSNQISIQMERAFMYSILGDFKKMKEILLELESNQPYFYVPSLLLAQYYYEKKKMAKAFAHAELAVHCYSTHLDCEGEVRVARDQFQTMADQFSSFGKHLQGIGSKIENRKNMFLTNFGEALISELSNGVDRTKKMFTKTQNDLFVQPEEFWDIIGLIYYDNRMYPEAYAHFKTALESAKVGDRGRLGVIHFHLALCSLFMNNQESCLEHGKNAFFHGWNGSVIHALNALAYRQMNETTKSKSELDQAVKGDSHVKESFFDLLEGEFKRKEKEQLEMEEMIKQVRLEDQ